MERCIFFSYCLLWKGDCHIMKFLRIVGIVLLISIALAIILTGGWILRMRSADPVKILERNSTIQEVVYDSTYQVALRKEQRIYRDISLVTGEPDTIRCTISLPESVPESGLPVLIILGGLEVGRESLRYIPYHGQNILIAYQYPYSPRYWYQGSPLRQIPAIQRAALKVPSQTVTLGRWMRRQSWWSGTPVSLLGYSFGAMFVPAIHSVSDPQEGIFGSTVLAYGGADLSILFHANLELPEPLRSLGAFLLETAVYPLEPLHHLNRMSGNILVMNGLKDDQVPGASWKLLQNRISSPKTVKLLDRGHMHPKKKELTLQIVRISQEWLADQGAINAIPWY